VSAAALVFALLLFLAYLVSEQRERPVWGILLAFSIISGILNAILWDHINEDWEHIAFASIDWACLLLIWRICPNRLGVFQISCLFVAWIVNWILYFDLVVGTNVVYDHYESYILGIDLMQLFPASYGIAQAFNRICGAALGTLRDLRSSRSFNPLRVDSDCAKKEETQASR
jgi:hypothetical protein